MTALPVVRVYLVRSCAALDARTRNRLEASCSASERARVSSIADEGRLTEFLLGRALARVALADLAMADASLHAERGRRPYALAANGDRHHGINLSHSRDIVACAVGPGAVGALGLDVEVLRQRSGAVWRRVADTARAHPVFSPRERSVLSELPEDRRDAVLLALWTIKEAIGKSRGTGIYRGDLARIDVDVDDLQAWCAGDTSAWHGRVGADWCVVTQRLDDAWVTAVTPGVPFAIEPRWLDVARLLDRIAPAS